MNDVFWGFAGAIIGSIISYFATLKVAKKQAEEARKLEEWRFQKQLAAKLLLDIDEYVLCSFRSIKEERQRAARTLFTSATLCIPERLADISDCLNKVDRYRYDTEAGQPASLKFSSVDDFFNQIKNEIISKYFDPGQTLKHLK